MSFCFKFADDLAMPEGQSDFVEAMYQAVLAKGVDLEAHHAGLIHKGNRLGWQVNGQFKPRKRE